MDEAGHRQKARDNAIAMAVEAIAPPKKSAELCRKRITACLRYLKERHADLVARLATLPAERRAVVAEYAKLLGDLRRAASDPINQYYFGGGDHARGFCFIS